ncbi:MAG: hypothetical protein ACI4DO_05575 [Roseburia sp.]
MAEFVLSDQILRGDQVEEFSEDAVEMRLLEDFLYVLDKMELNNELFVYLDLYEILKNNSIEARKLQNQLMILIKERKLIYKQNRLETVVSYGTYSYMKKKWKSFLKSKKRKEPSWEEVIHVLDQCFSPIWAAMYEDRIYIGDWMPEISRYL